jgi:prepilin signal peptidase PulO-like enzyme (type II secretory pathway)
MIELLLDILAAIGEAFASWRFYLCVAIVAIVIGAIYGEWRTT